MVWGCFCGRNRGPFTPLIVKSVDKHVYVKMLDYLFLPVIARVQNTIGSPVFQQNKAPVHKTRVAQAFFDQNHITVEDWPAISPDLDPIEHVLVELKRWLHVRSTPTLKTQEEGQIRCLNGLLGYCQKFGQKFQRSSLKSYGKACQIG
jgi:transposase